MAHKALIGGTAYNITGGKSLVSGTSYNITSGRTLVGGTRYDIMFGPPYAAMLYSDGNMVFQIGTDVEEGKTLVASYTGFVNTSYNFGSYAPWLGKRNNITHVLFKDDIATDSMSFWFYGARNLTTVDFININWSSLRNIAYAYYNCYNLTGSPVCGNNVTNMYMTYSGCYNLTGSPVCGDNVTNMHRTYYNCRNLTGSPACGNNVTSMLSAYYHCINLGINLTSNPILAKDNVTNMYYAYYNCTNLGTNRAYHNFYIYSKEVTSMTNCFYNCNFFNASYRINIYVPNNSNTLKIISNNSQSVNIFGKQINWTNYTNYYYNSTYFIYIYTNKIN